LNIKCAGNVINKTKNQLNQMIADNDKCE